MRVENVHTALIVLASGVEIPVGGSVDLSKEDVDTSGFNAMVADGMLKVIDGGSQSGRKSAKKK